MDINQDHNNLYSDQSFFDLLMINLLYHHCLCLFCYFIRGEEKAMEEKEEEEQEGRRKQKRINK